MSVNENQKHSFITDFNVKERVKPDEVIIPREKAIEILKTLEGIKRMLQPHVK